MQPYLICIPLHRQYVFLQFILVLDTGLSSMKCDFFVGEAIEFRVQRMLDDLFVEILGHHEYLGQLRLTWVPRNRLAGRKTIGLLAIYYLPG